MSTSPTDEASASAQESRVESGVQALERALGHRFDDRVLLATALRHSSYAHESNEGESNERLEFLGDAVLEIAVAELLYESHPDWAEGDLTRGLHQLVDRSSLAAFSRTLGVGPHLELGRTEIQSGGREKDSILADAVEALLGAIYLDAGLLPVKQLLLRSFPSAFVAGAPRVRRDPKTELQERLMADQRGLPRYALVEDSGIEGDEDRFTAEVRIEKSAVSRGQGRSKRLAERRAAERALEVLDGRRAPIAEHDAEAAAKDVQDD